MTRNTAPEKLILQILACTARANIVSMTQLRQFPMLNRNLAVGMSLWLDETLRQQSLTQLLHSSCLQPEQAAMQALQRLLYRPLRFRDLSHPTVAMDRILSAACSDGPLAAMALLKTFMRNTCMSICRAC